MPKPLSAIVSLCVIEFKSNKKTETGDYTRFRPLVAHCHSIAMAKSADLGLNPVPILKHQPNANA
ncbi:hypothetical protein [Conchiformibius steedae]|uniref:hypothetical protein n=1 Tax=Conchiformibius steedae TaxID=153493 RepID=UPI0026F03B95|nr:hypothetical protein [Conchiformibius steedae]